MKTIQWFPGHMAKAMRMMEENLKLCDAVLFVLDARVPASSYNARLADMAGGKPVLYLLNKADMADGGADGAAALIKGSGKAVIRSDASSPATLRPLLGAMEALVAGKRERFAQKGTVRPMRFLVAGIPNTGKSTLINLLSGGKKAQVGDRAGVTRAKQWVRCGTLELLDTPGTMPPALALLEELWEKYPDRLAQRYAIGGGTPLEMYEALCARRGFVLRGGEYDYTRGALALLDDFRKGRLGRVCLDNEEDLKAAGLI